MTLITEDIIQAELEPMLNRLAPNAHWHFNGPIGRTRKCDIFKITNNMQTHTLALKIYRPNVTKARGAKTQFTALKVLEENKTPSSLSTPQAYAFLPETNAFVMDWVKGTSLRSLLWRNTFSPRSRLALITTVARWLRRFHEHSTIQNDICDYNTLLDHLIQRMETSSAHISEMKDGEVFAAAYTCLKEQANTIQMKVPHAMLHGDFTPTNVLIQGGEVTGIDIWRARRAPVYEDIARMLTYICIDTPFALKRAPLINNRHLTSLYSAFNNGYGHDLMQHNNSAFWYIMLYQYLRRWLVFLNWEKQNLFPVLAQLKTRQASRLTQQTLEYIQAQF